MKIGRGGIIASQSTGEWSWTKEYDGSALPDSGGDYDWAKDGTEDAAIDTGTLHLTDDNVANRINYYRTGGAGFNNATGWTVEFSIKTVSFSASGGNQVFINDGTYNLTVDLDTNEISIADNDTETYAIDLTDTQHVIRITGKTTDYKVYVDGSLGIDGTLSTTAASPAMQFGCTSNSATGEAYWDYLNYYTGGQKAP